MLPDIDSQKPNILAIGDALDNILIFQIQVGEALGLLVVDKPSPARSLELMKNYHNSGCLLVEFLLEILDGAPFIFDGSDDGRAF